MSIDRIRYFAAVVETKNLRKAAELVGISPPSMSKAISVLEYELGHKLTHADGRGIGITPKGLEIYKASVPLLEEYRNFHQRIKSEASSTHQLRLATFEVFSSHFIAAFLRAEKAYEFLLLEMSPGKIEESILDGTVDFGLTYLPAPDSQLEYVEIGSFEMGIFGKDSWAMEPFLEWPFAIPTTELKIHSSEIDSLDMWPRHAPKRTVKQRFELLETALQTSAQGSSVIYCPDFIVKLHNERVKANFHLSSLPHPTGYKKPKPLKVYLVGKRGNINIELERKLAKFMRSLK